MADIQAFINNLVKATAEADKAQKTEPDAVMRQLRQKLSSAEFHIDVNWRDFSDLYILNVSNKSKLENPFVRKCNGVIFDQNTHKIVCYSFPVFMDKEDYPNPPDQPLQVESMYDGTLMKIFYHPSSGKWETATTKCFDADRSHWTSKKSFHELLMETLGPKFNFNELDKTKCYIGLLIHPENKLVSDYFGDGEGRFKEPTFVHTGTCNLETLEFDPNYEKLKSDSVVLPEKKEFANVDALMNFLKGEEMTQPIRPGFICLVNGERYKFVSPHYTMCKELRGNIQNMKYRLLNLMQTDETAQRKFLKLFPEYNDLNQEVKNDVAQLGETVYRNYGNYYFKQQKDKKYPDDIFEVMKAFNNKYREDLEKVGGDRSRIKTDVTSVTQFLVSKYPFEKLTALLGYKENNNRKEKPVQKPVQQPRGPPRGRGGGSRDGPQYRPPPRGQYNSAPTGGRGGPPRGSAPTGGRGGPPPRGQYGVPTTGGRGQYGVPTGGRGGPPPRGQYNSVPTTGGRGGPPRGPPRFQK